MSLDANEAADTPVVYKSVTNALFFVPVVSSSIGSVKSF